MEASAYRQPYPQLQTPCGGRRRLCGKLIRAGPQNRLMTHCHYMTAETEKLTLHCCECSREIDESAVLAFRGAFACEKCVRKYYRNRPEIELELQEKRREAIRILPEYRKTLEKLAAKKAASNKKTALIAAELQHLKLVCIECGTEIHVSTAFEFRGSVACEKCVRGYYRERPTELEFELELRRRNVVSWVKSNRKMLEKRAAK